MNHNTIAYTYLERLYHEWTNAHTYTQEQLHAAYIPAPLYEGLTRQRACPERQTAGITETAMNVTHRDVHIERPPRSMKPCWRNSSGLKRRELKMNK